jgi:hypothetical protein
MTGRWKHPLGNAPVPLASAWTYAPAPGHPATRGRTIIYSGDVGMKKGNNELVHLRASAQ